MSEQLPPRRSFESLKKEAKRRLAALRAGAADTITTLRDIQHALAREHGFPGWAALKDSFTPASRDNTLAQFEAMAETLIDAYRTGTRDAMERLYRITWHRRPWQGMRTYVQLDLGKRPSGPDDDVDITLDDARYIVARDHGFANWDELKAFTESPAAPLRRAAKPVSIAEHAPDEAEQLRTIASSRDWDAVIRLLATHPGTCLQASGQMTDDVLADVANVENIVALDLSGSKAL